MGRVAIFEMLLGDADLADAGINADLIWPMFSLDVSPRDQEIWLILRWGAETARFGSPGGKRNLDVWAYQPRQLGVDYLEIDKILGLVVKCLTQNIHFAGSDGSVFVTADFLGYGPDSQDPGWDAIARSAQFSVLLREP